MSETCFMNVLQMWQLLFWGHYLLPAFKSELFHLVHCRAVLPGLRYRSKTPQMRSRTEASPLEKQTAGLWGVRCQQRAVAGVWPQDASHANSSCVFSDLTFLRDRATLLSSPVLIWECDEKVVTLARLRSDLSLKKMRTNKKRNQLALRGCAVSCYRNKTWINWLQANTTRTSRKGKTEIATDRIKITPI